MGTPDETLREMLRFQNEANPDEDPGDVTIDCQDDSAMTAVFQEGRWLGVGGSIQEALDNALANVKADRTVWEQG